MYKRSENSIDIAGSVAVRSWLSSRSQKICLSSATALRARLGDGSLVRATWAASVLVILVWVQRGSAIVCEKARPHR